MLISFQIPSPCQEGCPMTENGKKIMNVRWWEWWKDPPVKEALHFGVSRPWQKKVADALKKRRKSKSEKSFPHTQTELCEAAALSEKGAFVTRRDEQETEQMDQNNQKRTVSNP